jgi:ribonuclease Y
MLTLVTEVAVALVAASAVFAYWVATRRRIAAETVGRAEEQASRILRDAEREADTRRKEALLEAKERAHELRLEAEQYARDHRQQIAGMEQIVARREAALKDQATQQDRAEADLRRREAAIVSKEQDAEAAARKYQELVARQQHELERVSGLTADEARDILLRQIESDARRDAANLVKRLEAEAREHAQAQARSIITQAIQRSAAEHTTETTVSVVDLPSDDLKGRIIGREGRNIRALELATGVDLIVDDTPGAIILSAFDPYRREVARRVIERLIADGRIHPARIEEVVEKVRSEMEDAIRKDGEAAAFELGLHDLHPEVLSLMGRLQFRTSYGQNILHHSREVAYLAGVMARELGLDAHVAVRAAFLHDIGKAIDRDIQGTHLELGLEFLKKHGESDPVLQAVAAHHMDIDWPSLEAMIVQAADAISAARPGARRDILESYVKRLEKLEGIADSFKGVSKSFALQAGRISTILSYRAREST